MATTKKIVATREEKIIELLWDSMKRDRRQTGWGTKTKTGLVASVTRIFDEPEGGAS